MLVLSNCRGKLFLKKKKKRESVWLLRRKRRYIAQQWGVFLKKKCESARLWRGRRDPSPSSIPQQQNMQHLGMNLSEFNFIRRLPSSFNKYIHNIHHCWRSLYWGWVGIITHSVTAWMEGGRLANFHNRLLCCCCCRIEEENCFWRKCESVRAVKRKMSGLRVPYQVARWVVLGCGKIC